jgi:hypothetical protein
MGLTIHYKLSLPRGADAPVHRRIVQFRARVEKRCSARNGMQVFPATTDAVELNRWACAYLAVRDDRDPECIHPLEVPPIGGCIFPVSIGEGCEPLWLGLCRYPETIQLRERAIRTGQSAGWRFSAGCKTQYASVHGWEHFLRCHSTVVELLRLAVESGIQVRITDEGGWWPRRSDQNLRRAIEKNNRLVAAVGGALKDRAGDQPQPVQSPIFEHPDFERLESEGIHRQSNAVARVVDEIAKLGLRP